jgi:hypothetical protein
MSRPASPIVCDGPGCGKHREKDTNHWWTVGVWDRINHEENEPQHVILIVPTRETQHISWSEPDYYRDFCGTECAAKFISEQMGKARGETNDGK